MNKLRTVLTILTLLFVVVIAIIISYYARGYRFDINGFSFTVNGILVAKSDPDGAQVFINGELETATNQNIHIKPGVYDITIKKNGYIAWNKRLKIEKEVVTQANATLFPSAPSLSAITFSGVARPLATHDLTRVSYEVPDTAGSQTEIESGLWVIDMVNLPLGFSNEPRIVTNTSLEGASWEWSPNGREILLTTERGVFLVEAGTFTPQNQLINISTRKEAILEEWLEEKEVKLESQLKNLPDELVDILDRKANSIVFSPDKKRVMYSATGDATVPNDLIPPLPGASTQKESRDIKEGHTYVYDIKEDRNFEITGKPILLEDTSNSDEVESPSAALRWFPSSGHLILSESDKITIMDYDGTNRQVVYSGSYISPYAYPFVTGSRLLILTNLGANSATANLYSLGLK